MELLNNCYNCKHLKQFDYEYCEDTLWEVAIGVCHNTESENFNSKVYCNEDTCDKIDIVESN